MRVAMVITGLGTGGAETMLLKLLERIDRDSFDCRVFSLTDLGEVGPKIAALGIPVEALEMRRSVPDPRALLALARRLKAIKADLVHTWMYHADLLGGLAGRLAGVRCIVWGIRNSDLDASRTGAGTRFVVGLNSRLSGSLPTGILSCAEVARAAHIALGYAAAKFEVIPNGFDIERFHVDPKARASVRAELGLPATATLIGAVGRFDPQKNHLGLLRAAGLLRESHPLARLVLVGKGLDESNQVLVDAARREGLAESVYWLGRRDDIPRLMASLDVYVSSSYGEAFPNVVGEAMASGVPCAVTDAGDCAAIVSDTGRVVRVGDMQALAGALADLLALDSAARADLGRRARERVVAHFELGRIVRRYEDYYRRQCTAAA
jgi:glycosyltransferase involved in cell wall biosynthesis